MRDLRLPLTVATAGHASAIALLVLIAGVASPLVLPPRPPKAVQVVFAAPEAETPPPPAAAPPPPDVESSPPIEPPAPLAVRPAAVPVPKPAPRKPRPVEHRFVPEPEPNPMPALRQPLPPPAVPLSAAPQLAAVSVPRPAPAAAPVVSAGYRGALSAWLESHKRYPESARQRGEQGRAVLRFRVDRGGRVLGYSVVSSTGYPDLDESVETMMRGAQLPPFPPDMNAPEIEVSVTVHFGLTR